MATFNMHDAKTQLSDLVARAEAGEEVFIARRNKPAVKLAPVEGAEKKTKGKRRAPALTPAERAALAPLAEIDWFEHAPDEYISKEDIAAYYRKHPHAWDEMRAMVGFAADKPSEFDVQGVRKAVEAGREFTIMRNGKAVAKVVPADEKKPRVPGRFAHLRGNLPPDLFDQPLSEDELDAWEGKYSGDGDR